LLVLQFIAAACSRGEKAALFVFDEELGLLFRRSGAMGIDKRLINDGSLRVTQVDTPPNGRRASLRTTSERK
jgi:circadian clock protein KaiC